MSLRVNVVIAGRFARVAWRQGGLGVRCIPRVDRGGGPSGQPFGKVADENHLRHFVACVLGEKMNQDSLVENAALSMRAIF